MNKFKKVMLGALSVLTLGLFVATGARVDAADVFPYLAANDNRTSDIGKSTKFLDDDTLSVSTDGSSKANIVSFDENDGYTQALAHLSNGGGFVFSSKKDINLTVKFFVRDANNFYAGTYTFSNDLGSGETTASAAKSVTVQLGKDSSTTLTAKVGTKDRRVAIVEISYEEQSVSSDYELDSISVTNSKSYNLNDTFDATAISVKGLYKNKEDATDTKELSLNSDDYSVVLKNSSNTAVTSFETAGTYTVTVTVNDTNISNTCNISIANVLVYDFYSANTSASNTTVTVVEGKISLENSTAKLDKSRKATFNGTTFTSYQQASIINFTLDSKAKVSFYVNQTATTQYVHDRSTYIKDSSNNIIMGTGYTPVVKPSDGATVTTYQSVVLPAGTYKYVSPLGTMNMWGMEINYDTTENTIDTDCFVNFQWQLDSSKTKVRFVGTLNGITDLSKLDNIYVDVVLINGSNNPHHATIVITNVYKAVLGSGDSSKETAVDGIYYTVCSISGLDSLKAHANTADSVTGTWTIKAKLYYTYDGVQNVISAASAVSGF